MFKIFQKDPDLNRKCVTVVRFRRIQGFGGGWRQL